MTYYTEMLEHLDKKYSNREIILKHQIRTLPVKMSTSGHTVKSNELLNSWGFLNDIS